MNHITPKLYTAGYVILLYMLLFFMFEPSVYYHHHQPMFLFSRSFMHDFLTYPGGLLDWITLFVFQFFLWNWVGSLILTMILITIFLLLFQILKKAVPESAALLGAFLPVVCLLFLIGLYNAPLVIGLRLLAALIIFRGYIAVGQWMKPLFVLLLVPVYYLIGGWTFLFYSFLVILWECFRSGQQQGILYAVIHLIAAFLLPFIAGKRFFLITFREAFFYLYPVEFGYEPYRFVKGPAVYGLFISVPLVLFILLISGNIQKHRFQKFGKIYELLNLKWLQFVLISVISCLILCFSHDRTQKTKICIDRFAVQGHWEQVVKHAVRLKMYDREVNAQFNRALYFQGALLNRMFSYPQILGSDGLLIHRYIASQIALPASDILFDLAHIHGAQTLAYEGQTKMQVHPRLLKRLVLTHLINGQYQAARKFVSLLKQSLIHRSWAREAEPLVTHETRADAHPLIITMRAMKPYRDFFFNNQNPQLDLIQLVEQNPKNRMAFEYLIAYYLLNARLMNIYERLSEFKQYGYRSLPRHVEEAMFLLRILSDSRELDIPVSRDTYERYRDFDRMLRRYYKNPKVAQKMLKRNFGDTYWYYVRYVNPRKTNLKLKKRAIDEG